MMKHKLEIGKALPNGGRQFILDGKDLADDVAGFSINWNQETRQIVCDITIYVDEAEIEGVDVVTMGKVNPWTKPKEEDGF